MSASTITPGTVQSALHLWITRLPPRWDLDHAAWNWPWSGANCFEVFSHFSRIVVPLGIEKILSPEYDQSHWNVFVGYGIRTALRSLLIEVKS